MLREPTELEMQGIRNIMNKSSWIIEDENTTFNPTNKIGFVIRKEGIKIKED